MQKSIIASVMIILIVGGMWGLRLSPVYRADLADNPDDPAIARLLIGNARFVRGLIVHEKVDAHTLHELSQAQHPFAVVVTCSDSRVPPELLFDQGFGDLFVIRTAGNVIGDLELGSIEYAIEHLGVKQIVILGHENCGALKAYVEHGHHPNPGHIEDIVQYLANEPEEKAVNQKAKDVLDRAIEANVLHGVHLMQQTEPILSHSISSGKVQVNGAVYSLSNGSVSVLF